jgi:NADPH2:quinone reductase
MRAMIIREFGGPEVFEAAEIEKPTPGPGEVLVRMAATSVNPVDHKLRKLGPPIAAELPAVLGCDVCGEVTEVGEGVTEFNPGDMVFGCAGGVRGMPGTYAEWIAADARLLARVPAGLSPREAAALPLVTITAWEGLIDRAKLQAGESVLVLGGTGGVGHVAVQLAKSVGAVVTASVSSERKAEIARSLGAEAVWNHREEPLAECLRRQTAGHGFDVVYDATGTMDFARAFEAARLNGQVISIVSQCEADLTPMHIRGLTLHVVFMLIPMLHGIGREHHGEILRGAAELVEAGKLRPLLDDSEFTLDEIAQAHRRLEAGEATGKVAITID